MSQQIFQFSHRFPEINWNLYICINIILVILHFSYLNLIYLQYKSKLFILLLIIQMFYLFQV